MALCHILRHTTSPEVTEYALELIQAICEQDTSSTSSNTAESARKDPQSNNSITFGLAKSNLCLVMMELITGRFDILK